MSFVIFDTEYTSWKGCQENGWHGFQKKEIVQIAALKVTDNLDVLAEINILCRPIINPVLSDYFINLTHITNEDIAKEGIPFEQAFMAFKKFVGKDICFSHGWGADLNNKSDGNIIDENIKLYALSQKNDLKYFNVADVFKQIYREKNIQILSQASGDIPNLLGIQNEMENLILQKHNALYDVYAILVGLRHFKNEAISLIKPVLLTK